MAEVPDLGKAKVLIMTDLPWKDNFRPDQAARQLSSFDTAGYTLGWCNLQYWRLCQAAEDL